MNHTYDFDEIAREAATDYRLIDGLVGEMKQAGEDTLVPYNYIRRFYRLHKSFYAKMVILSMEGDGQRNEEFVKEVRAEQRKLAQICYYIRRNQAYLLSFTLRRNLEEWSNFFAECVCCVLEEYGIDETTNTIYYHTEE